MNKKLILDTDVGSDCDDMLAIAYLAYAVKKCGWDLSAITYSHTCPHAIAAIRALLRSLNTEIPPIGKMPCEWVEKENYSKKVAEKFAIESDYADVPIAVQVLRETLVKNEKTTICAIGPLTNIADLLSSPADEISPLSGVELVREKCEKLIVMGGRFTDEENGERLPEWNFSIDIAATEKMLEVCPVPIVFLPFEVGKAVLTGGVVMDKYGENHPLSLSFLKFGNLVALSARAKGNSTHTDVKTGVGRFSWDPITAVYTVEGARDWLEESACGKAEIDENGVSYFVENENGLHKVLRFNSKRAQAEVVAELGEYINACALEICEAAKDKE